MATKDCFSLSLKSKQDIVFGDNSNVQYNNLNLNQNHQNFSLTAFSEHSKNVTIKNIKVSNSDSAKNDYSKNDSFNLWKKESTKNLPLNFEKENKWKEKISNIKNSTLSLHVGAYENLFEAVAFEARKEADCLKPKNEKQIFNDLISVIRHPFEFPRQKRSDEEKTMPEISQFKASQRLLNPNQMYRSNYKKPSAQDSGESSGLTHMTHVSKVPPARESISLLTVERLHPQALTGSSAPMAVVALITRNYDPKGDFVPLETILDDYISTDTGKMSSASSSSEGSLCCCIHGAPCECGTSLSSYRSSRSISSNEPEYQSLGYVNAMKKSSNKNVHYPLRSDSYYVKIRSPSSTEKVQIDQNKNNIGQPLSKRSTKTRWPLAELTAEMAYSTGNRTSMENLHQPQHAKDDAFYDFYSDREEDDDTKSLGRRKNKKNKCYHKNDNDEKYPKLESVLEDTGYIELKVSSSKESKRSTGPKSCRRKDKKTPRDYL